MGRSRHARAPAAAGEAGAALQVRTRIRAVACGVLVGAFLVPAGALAQVVCGTVVGRGEKRVLSGDLGPCDGVEAAILLDGGALDLGGYTLRCATVDGALARGVVVIGKRSKLANGTILGCATGVSLGGDGRHRVTGVTVRESQGTGIEVLPLADRCKLVDVGALANAEDGIELRSDRNRLVRAVSADNGDEGFDLPTSAERNKLIAARAERNGDAGLIVDGSKNALVKPTATQNGTIGIDLGGSANRVSRGSAQSNRTYDLANCAGDKVKRLTFGTATDDCR